jgi:hypothetical protein
MLTIESGILPKYSRAAGLDKTQQSYNDKWSCPLTPKENRLKCGLRQVRRSITMIARIYLIVLVPFSNSRSSDLSWNVIR